MNCPKCGGHTRVAYCHSDCESVQRLRECRDCRHRFYTSEYESSGEEYKNLSRQKERKRRMETLLPPRRK